MARLSTPHDLTAYAERGDRQPISAFPCRPLLALMSATNRVDQGSLGEERVAGIGKAITGARVVPVEGEPIDGGTVMIEAGKIVAIEGPGFAVPDDVEVVDAAGKWVLPGFIDAHAHVGLAEEAEGWAGRDVNELTRPGTAYARALDATNPADQGFRDASEGGVLAENANPGPRNPIGAQTGALQVWGRTARPMGLAAPARREASLRDD